MGDADYLALGKQVADYLDRSRAQLTGERVPTSPTEPVVITGAALGLPGAPRLFDDANVGRILHGEQGIDVITTRIRHEMLDKHITRLVKGEGGARFETIDSPADVIKLAARAGEFDLAAEFDIDHERVLALGRETQLAMAAGIDALRDAGVPLVLHYRTTSVGSLLPERWSLPDELRDSTGVIFASAFPGFNDFADELTRFGIDVARREELAQLEAVRVRVAQSDGQGSATAEIDRRIHDLQTALAEDGYTFDRRFLFRVLSMGHSQFAELIGARGPNTQLNAACASTTQAVALAEDWISTGRCQRVVIIAADDVTSDHMLGWIGAGFLASGAAATDEDVEEAAVPFDRRRHGMLLGMGAAALVVESAAAARERGIRPICQVLGSVTANSAFHGTRLDVEHIGGVMESVVAQAERRGVRRQDMAPAMVFMSHETYTPARGGSAAAEVNALRRVFGAAADQVVVANTKGFTGHPMGVGIEDVVAVKALETGVVPPVPNFKEPDPELGPLNLSAGGVYDVRYALRLAAGFGSQISMVVLGWVPTPDGRRPNPDELGFAGRVADPAMWRAWLTRVSGDADPQLEVDHRTLRVAAREGVSAGPAAAAAPPTAAAAPAVATPPAAAAPLPAPTAPAPVAPVAAPPAPAADPLVAEVVGLVAEQTGYPADLLDLDLDLEADLGIDTVKQAELFAQVRETYGIARDDNLQLRDYPTLNHVVAFVRERAPQAAVRPPPRAMAAPTRTLRTGRDRTSPGRGTSGAGRRSAGGGGRRARRRADRLPRRPPRPRPRPRSRPRHRHRQASRAVRPSPRDLRHRPRRQPPAPRLPHPQPRRRLRPRTRPPTRHRAAPAEAAAPGAAAPPAPGRRSAGGGGRRARRRADRLPRRPPRPRPRPRSRPRHRHRQASRAVRPSPRDLRHRPRRQPPAPRLPHPQPRRRLRPRTRPPTRHRACCGRPPRRPPRTRRSRPRRAASTGFPRRVPVPLVRPPLAWFAPTGVALGDGSRVVVLPDAGGVAEALAELLASRGVTVLAPANELNADELKGQLDAWLAEGPIEGIYALAALDNEGPIASLDVDWWHGGLHWRVRRLGAAARALYDRLAEPGTFLVTATRNGGAHGYDEAGARSAMAGAVSGFTKALARERPSAVVKVVDVEDDTAAGEIATVLVDETLRDQGVVEVGRRAGDRLAIGLEEQEAQPSDPGRALGPSSVVVVTGAAGSIVSAIVADLAAAAGGGTFHLLDLIPEPDHADPDLPRLTSDRDGLKRDLAERISARGERATPAMIERELAAIERRSAAVATMQAVTGAGGTAQWHSADLRDGEAVGAAVHAIRAASDHVDLLVHAGGLEISHFLPDKPEAEFDLVFDVKVDGWFHLLRALGDTPVGTAVVFSSIAGRFGNGGQTDYSAANDLLCKSVSSFRTSRPSTRGIAVDWTAWADIGMASRGSIPKMMAVAGIDMLPPAVGIPVVRREVTAGGPGGELVVAGSLGLLLEDHSQMDTDATTEAGARFGPMVTGLEVRDHSIVAVADLDPASQPFLDHHRIDGTPVLPGVMGMEAFAEAALSAAPGWQVEAIENVAFLAPFKFYRDEPRRVEVHARLHPAGDRLVADCQLIGRRALAGQGDQVTTHFTGRVVLAPDAGDLGTHERPEHPSGPVAAPGTIYQVYFHGPAYQVLAGAWGEGGTAVGQMATELVANHNPDTEPLVAAPRLVELCFQTAGLPAMAADGSLGLPARVRRVQVAPGATEAAARWAVVTPGEDGGVDAVVLGEEGEVLVRLAGYETIALPGAAGADVTASLQAALR